MNINESQTLRAWDKPEYQQKLPHVQKNMKLVLNMKSKY